MKKMLLTITMLLLAAPIYAAADRSPFTDVIYDSAPSITVQVNGEQYFLLGVNGTRRADIFKDCEAVYASKCRFMFAEQFSTTMEKIGRPVGETVKLDLYKMEGHQVLAIDNAPVTIENQEEVVVNRALRGEE